MATRPQLVNLRIFLLNLAFDFTLNDKDFQGFTQDCVHEHDVQQAFIYNSVLAIYELFQKRPGPEEVHMIPLTKEWFDF